MRRILGSVVAILGLTAFAAPAARADIFAAVCVGNGGGDIAVLNAATGARRTLPAGVNTSDFEQNPSISSDGRRLLFRRLVLDATPRLIAVDLTTGQSADLFDPFELAQDGIALSTIAPNGATVATGRALRSVLGFFLPRVTLTSLASFPSGPFSRSTLGTSRRYTTFGAVSSAAASNGNLFAVNVQVDPHRHGEIFLVQLGGRSSAAVRHPDLFYSNPALAASNPEQVLFVQGAFVNGTPTYDIVFRPATLSGFPGTPTTLREGVSTAEIETLPALTADGRYIGFVRSFENPNRNDRLFVWDSQTRVFLNPNGINLGMRGSHGACGSASIYIEPLLASSVITSVGNVNATLISASSVGIFVQRIVGKTRVLGRKAYRLETVGRVPLGSYGAGNVFTSWDFAVDDEPLAPGKYLVTVRAVEDDVVRELGQPQVLRIDQRGRAHMLRKDRR